MSLAAEYEAFWSYAHEDNDRHQGRVLKLAEAIQDEFAVTTGNDLDMFLDRRAIEWGDLWRNRIDHALGQVPFFIAVITPKYVKSVECRRELLAFNREAKSRGIGRLLLPIVYINVKDLSESSDDEVLAIIARTQYVDWRNLRLKSPDDPEVLRAINTLAGRMEDLLGEVAVATQKIEARTDAEQVDSLNDIVENIDEKLNQWMETVEFDRLASRVWVATVEERVARIQRMLRSRQRGGPMLAIWKRLGTEILPIAVDRLEKAKDYAKLTIDLDPLVTAAIHYVEERPELAYMLDRLSDGVHEAELNIEPPETNPNGLYALPLPKEAVRYSKSAQDADQLMIESQKYADEANVIVLGWRDKLSALGRDPVAPGSPESTEASTNDRDLPPSNAPRIVTR